MGATPPSLPVTILRTRDGGFVTEVTLPPFHAPPDVLVWGERIFAYSKDDNDYREAFAYFVPSVSFLSGPARD